MIRGSPFHGWWDLLVAASVLSRLRQLYPPFNG